MIKKIPIEQLRPGMFLHDIDTSWMERPILSFSLMITSVQEIEKLTNSGVRAVYIDVVKGLDAPDAPTAQEVKTGLEQEMEAIVEKGEVFKPASLNDELAKAQNIVREANSLVRNILMDIRLGKQVELEQLEPVVEQMTGSIFRNQDALISLCRIKQKDDYTFQHSVGVGTLMMTFCRAQGMDYNTIKLVGIGGLLHDIGKMKTPDMVLNKPGKLTDEEFVVMKSHVVHSREILSDTPGIVQASLDVAAQHHERFDGSGYPLGLKGDEISIYGQMASIVDVYDAITSDRCYHKGMEPTTALRKMFEWSKFHFNPELVHTFVRTIGIYPVGTLVKLESGRLGVVIEQREKNLVQPLVRVMFSTKKNHYIKPENIDLSKPLGAGGADKIVSHESPLKWGINTSKFM